MIVWIFAQYCHLTSESYVSVHVSRKGACNAMRLALEQDFSGKVDSLMYDDGAEDAEQEEAVIDIERVLKTGEIWIDDCGYYYTLKVFPTEVAE